MCSALSRFVRQFTVFMSCVLTVYGFNNLRLVACGNWPGQDATGNNRQLTGQRMENSFTFLPPFSLRVIDK